MPELFSIFLFCAAVALYASKAGRNLWWFFSILLILTLFIVLNVTLFISNYFTGDGINDAVLYTLTSSLTGAGVGKYLLPGVGVTLILGAVFGGLTWILRRKKQPFHMGYSLLALVLALLSIKTTPAYQQVCSLITSQNRHGDSDFPAYYVIPEEKIAHPHLNLVYIYAESLERTYFDPQVFPDLTPELNAVKAHSLDFSQTTQLPGMDYTIAGMVASQCGIPLFAPFEGNSSASMSTFFPKNICLGDILKASGYQNYFIQGADLRFAGKDVFLASHGFDHMYGAQELKDKVAAPGYRNNWGFYDDTVLDEVYQSFMALSQSSQPFALFALTVDTHHPDGFISRSCQRRSYIQDGKENRSLSAVACSQEHIAALINKIKASPYFSNTVIVVSSDHLAMNNSAYKYLTAQQRENLFFVIRGDKPETAILSQPRNPMDNGATVLDLLGGGNAIGLGRSSLSAASLSTVFANMKEKVLSWKPDIIGLWQFPKTLNQYTVDQKKQTFSYSGASFRLPILLKVGTETIDPLPESEYSAPLRYQLSDFKKDDHFIWVDNCFKMGRLWAPDLSLSTGLCIARGDLDGIPQVRQITQTHETDQVDFSQMPSSSGHYAQNRALLKTDDNAIRYPSETYLFALPGAPEGVKTFSGLSRPEAWGRWSNANLAPEVSIEYDAPLPARFTLTLDAKAYGDNIDKPVGITVGEQTKTVILKGDLSTVTLTFDNPQRSHVLTIMPPAPQLSSEGNILGHDPRRLGVGLQSLMITPVR